MSLDTIFFLSFFFFFFTAQTFPFHLFILAAPLGLWDLFPNQGSNPSLCSESTKGILTTRHQGIPHRHHHKKKPQKPPFLFFGCMVCGDLSSSTRDWIQEHWKLQVNHRTTRKVPRNLFKFSFLTLKCCAFAFAFNTFMIFCSRRKSCLILLRTHLAPMDPP